MKDYQPYKNLPPLAGLCSFEEAAREGLSVGDCVARLKHYHYVLKRLSEIFTAMIPSEPIYELKMAFSHHAHLCSEHVTTLRARVAEMREPPLGLSKVPHAGLERLADEVRCAPTLAGRLLGIYEVVLPALEEAMKEHIAQTNPLADAPSVRVCRFALIEIADMLSYGRAAIASLVPGEERGAADEWLGMLRDCLASAGGLAGDGTVSSGAADVPAPVHSADPPAPDFVPRRDERFPDPYNLGVHAEEFLYDEHFPAEPKVLMMFYKRMREIDVPEMMASILAETPDRPWDYYRDMVRQLWDEARHAMMGEAGFVSLGVDWTKVMINHTWSLALNTQATAWERHAVLYYIEQGLMSRTGKRFEWEVGGASKHPLSKTFQDYDWADEVLHAKIGRDWYVSQFENAREAVEFGDRAWSKILVGWSEWKERGLTGHRNWWPDLYLDYCRAQGIEPAPEILGYHKDYENTRADLQEIATSG